VLVFYFSKRVLQHMSWLSKVAIHCCGFQELIHKAYSIDLAPRDLYRFSYLENYLKGKQLSCQFCDKELKSATEDWLKEQKRNFYLKAT